jgi:hypothetical protein
MVQLPFDLMLQRLQWSETTEAQCLLLLRSTVAAHLCFSFMKRLADRAVAVGCCLQEQAAPAITIAGCSGSSGAAVTQLWTSAAAAAAQGNATSRQPQQ